MSADQVRLISKITIEEIQQVGGDDITVAAARVSTRGWASVPDGESYGLTKALLTLHHTLPLEHSLLTVRVHAPALVWWEWVRHRFQAVDCPDLSFSLESGRYRELEPVFWIPARDRALVPVVGFKPIRPEFEPIPPGPGGDAPYNRILDEMHRGYAAAWASYQNLLAMNVSREVARAVLGFGVYYAGWCSGNCNAWLNFLSRRAPAANTTVPTYPQQEIADAALQVEEIFRGHWPQMHRAWNANGRVAP